MQDNKVSKAAKRQKRVPKPTKQSDGTTSATSAGAERANAEFDMTKKRKHRQDEKASSPGVKRKRSAAHDGPRNGDSDEAQTSARDILLEEIKALGGDEEDLALIGDIESGSEHDDGDADAEAIDPGLQKELRALAAQLGFPNLADGAKASKAIEDAAEVSSDDEDGEGAMLDEETEARVAETAPTKQMVPGGAAVEAAGRPVPDVKTTGLKKQFKIEPRADWHASQLPDLPQSASTEMNAYAGAIEALKSHAWKLLETDADAYSKSVLAAASHKFLSTIMSSGTLSDKVSALTLAIQESPVHNIKAFDTLMSLASKRSRGQAIGALGALVDLLGPGLILPAGRRLRPFHLQPGLVGAIQTSNLRRWSPQQRLPGNMSDGHLIAWVYEDWLKSTYFKVIQLLEVWCNDEIEYSRIKSLDFVYALLRDKPEQETNLLRLLVNKLGDRDRKISSRASYLLLQLQNSHPGMKVVIVKAIEQEVLLRPGQGHRAKYYAVATLNQTILGKKDPQTAEALLRIYFEIFVELLKGPVLGKEEDEPAADEPPAREPRGKSKPKGKGKGNVNNAQPANSADRDTVEKLVSAVLTGINRAAPFLAANDPILDNQVDTLFRIAHSSNFNTSIQALILIQQLSVSRNIAFDRFYRTLYESLLDPRLVNSSKQALYLNLVLRSLKADVDTRRVKAFVKRMLQVLSLHQPAFACGVLYIVLQLRHQFPDLRTLLEEAEEHDPAVEDPRETLGGAPANSGTFYDGRKRDPEHANAQHSCLWELTPFLRHFHPSVSVIAQGVLSNDEAVQKPELESHSLIRFLDKFVYRNPKVTESTRGVSIMQPVGKKGPSAAPAINHPSFWNKKLEHVAVDDVFFHHYFQQAGKTEQVQPKGRAGPMEDSDDEDEDEIWKALTASHPDGPVDGSDESDLDMGDLDSDFDQDDDGHDNDSSGVPDGLLSDESLGDFDDEDDDANDGPDMFARGENEMQTAVEGAEKKDEETRSSRKKRLKALPTFASIDDYADLLGQEEDI